jgi:hypothetical protein
MKDDIKFMFLEHSYLSQNFCKIRATGDEELELYLQQLVMAIKHQNFFRSALVDFLLGKLSCILFFYFY